MTKIDIISGFLGAGKTTLIKKLLNEAFSGQKLVLIENEFGEVSVDGGFLKDSGIQISEMSSGCICCSLVGDFGKALVDVFNKYSPDRIIIEPSGVGKLSDVIKAVENVTSQNKDLVLNSFITVADAKKCKLYMKNFGEFFNNQIENANCIILSRTSDIQDAKLSESLELIRSLNNNAVIITTPWEDLNGMQIVDAMEKSSSDLIRELESSMIEEINEDEHEHHHHHDEDECDDPNCSCHHHHHDEDEDDNHDHEHHHHHDEDECDDPNCSCHHHHHDEDEDEDDDHDHEHHHHHDEDECDDPNCSCHHHHHHHHADEVFNSWGIETGKKFTRDTIEQILKALDTGDYGLIVRSKGIVANTDGTWIHFDYVPNEYDIRSGSADVTGRICVIGSNLQEEKIKTLFQI